MRTSGCPAVDGGNLQLADLTRRPAYRGARRILGAPVDAPWALRAIKTEAVSSERRVQLISKLSSPTHL